MKAFEVKSNSHIVIKRHDVLNALNGFEIKVLHELLLKLEDYRLKVGKVPSPAYFVVNSDEPYAKLIFEIIKYGETHKGEQANVDV